MYASQMRQLTELLNQSRALGVGTVANAIFTRQLYTLLLSGPAYNVAGIIVGRMEISLPATIFTDHPDEAEKLVQTFSDIIADVYREVTTYMTPEHAEAYIIEAASSFNVTVG